MYCRNCGAQIKDDALFCENCGASQTIVASVRPEPMQEPQQVLQSPAPYQGKQRKKHGCLTAILVVLVAAIVFVIIVANIPDQEIDEMASDLSAAETKNQLKNGTENQQNNTNTKAQKYDVSIVSSSVEESEDTYYLVIQYSFTNNDTVAESFRDAFDVYIYQNGVQCLDYEFWRDESERHQERAKIQPGTTYQVRQAYRLYDAESTIEYEIKGGALFDTDTYAKGTISIK